MQDKKVIEILDKLQQQDHDLLVVDKVTDKWEVEKEKYLYKGTLENQRLRTVNCDEIITEFDNCTRERGVDLIDTVRIMLDNNKISYSIYDHGGKSPHLHIYNIQGLKELNDFQRHEYKKKFVKKFCPKLSGKETIDYSLCGKHLIALEYTPHFKYGRIKELIKKADYGQNKLIPELLEEVKQLKNSDFVSADTLVKPILDNRLKIIVDNDSFLSQVVKGIHSYNSPSEARMAALCRLVELGFDDQQIKAVMDSSIGLNWQEKDRLNSYEILKARHYVLKNKIKKSIPSYLLYKLKIGDLID